MNDGKTDQEIFEDFICRCGSEKAAAADELLREVKRRLAEGSEDLMPSTVTDANLLTQVVVSLEIDFNAHITQIVTDQWSAVHAENYDKTFKTRIQCDTVEDGVAATWKAFADHKANAGATGLP